MSSPPSSLPVSLMAALTLFSSVMSQRNATARTPKLLRSITVCCASRAECRKVIATSVPALAIAKAVGRPSRRAPPVINADFPCKSRSVINGLYLLLTRGQPQRDVNVLRARSFADLGPLQDDGGEGFFSGQPRARGHLTMLE